MNIYYISLYYDNNFVTGANKRYDEIGKRLYSQSNVNLIAITTERNKPTWCDKSKWIEVRSYRNRFQRLLSWFDLSIKLKSLPPGIVINDFMPVPMFMSKHKHVQLIHDLRNFETFKRGGLGLFTSCFQKRQLSKSDKIITVSKYTASKIIEYCDVDKSNLIVSYNGIECSSKECSSIEKDVDLLYVATFEARKNHTSLLKAIELIERKLNVVFVGSDLGLKEEIKEHAEKINKEGVHNICFHEQLSDKELTSLYQRSKIFCSPSLYEGFGMPIIEAFNNNCIVVCSDIPVFHEVTLNSAKYFDPNSPADIANVIKNSLELPNDIEKSRKIASYFCWDEIAERLVKDINNEL